MGDVVYIPADEEHWHGADTGSCMMHTAVPFGRHDWLDRVTDEEYRVFAGRSAMANSEYREQDPHSDPA